MAKLTTLLKSPWAPLVAGAVLRLVIMGLMPYQRRFTEDTAEYFDIARSITLGHGFTTEHEPPFTPTFERTPTYPLFVALVWMTLGKSALSLVQIGLDLVTAHLVRVVGGRVFSPTVGIVAGWLFAVLPFTAGTSVQFMSEGIATLFLALSWWSVLRAEEGEGKPGFALLGGIALGAACMARPYLVALAPIAALSVLASRARVGKRKTALVLAAALSLGVALPIGAWVGRNVRAHVVHGTDLVLLQRYGSRPPIIYIWTPEFRSLLGSYDEPFIWLDIYEAPYANYLDAREKERVRVVFEEIKRNEGKQSLELRAEMADIVRERYARAPLRLYVWRPISMALKLWLSPRASSVRLSLAQGGGLTEAPRALTASFWLLNVALFGLAVAAVRRTWRELPDRGLSMWGPVLGLTVTIIVIVHRETRLSMPLFPILCVAAASSIVAMADWLARRGARAAGS